MFGTVPERHALWPVRASVCWDGLDSDMRANDAFGGLQQASFAIRIVVVGFLRVS
jgi:hypothetical protein